MASSNDTRSSSQGNIETNRGAMPAFPARALQTLHVQLVDELDIQIVKDHLFSNGLIDHHQMVELSGMKPREGTRYFLNILQQSSINGYQKFLKVLQDTRYFDLKLKIEETLCKQFPQNINIVLIGKTGVGKSRLGNSLLKKPAAFVSKQSMKSVTKVCSLQSCKIFHHGKEVTVNIIDSPGLADSNTSTNDIIREIANCMELTKGRVDVFIIVINVVERMTDEGKAPIHMLKDRYGVESDKFVLIVFTHIDQISDETNLEDLITEITFLRETISLFKNRYCSFGINSVDHDVKDIFNRIFTMIEENNYTYYSHCLFEAAAKNFDEQITAEKKRLEEDKKRKEEELKQKVRDELTKEIEDELRIEYEERNRKNSVAFQSLKEEQKRKDEKLKQKIRDELTKEIEEAAKNFDQQIAAEKKRWEEEQKRKDDKIEQKITDELTKEIEDKLRIEYEERYRKNSVAFQSLKEEQKRKDEKFKQKVRDELTKEIEDRVRMEYEERNRKNSVAFQSLKEEQKRKDEKFKQKVRDELTKEIEDRVRMEYEERNRKKPVDKDLLSLKLENRLASQSLEEEQRKEEDELTKEIEVSVRIKFEERYRKKSVALPSLNEEQKMEVGELTKEIEDSVRMKFENRLASQNLEEEQKRRG